MSTDVIVTNYQNAPRRLLLLDYDGTLRELCPTPEEAVPTEEIIDLLRALAADPKNTVVIVSGRDYQTLDAWLGDLPVSMIGGHGMAYRPAGGAWQFAEQPDVSWLAAVRKPMEQAVETIPGSFIEEKTGSYSWHYRKAQNPAAVDEALAALLNQLKPLAEQHNLRIIGGNKVVEVLPKDTNKGSDAQRWLGDSLKGFVLAVGDDVTDEDLFAAMPKDAFTIKIGNGESRAKHRLESPEELRNFLRKLAAS